MTQQSATWLHTCAMASSSPLQLLQAIDRELQPTPISTAAQPHPEHDRLLQGSTEAGALRSTPAAAAAARKRLVTREALQLVHAAQAELRHAQAQQQAPGEAAAGARSTKGRKSTAAAGAASAAAAAYSLDAGSRRLTDPGPLDGSGGKKAPGPAAADWGSFRDIRKLVAAPAAAAAKASPEALRVQQPYLSQGAAVKAADEAWQAPSEDTGWRNVLAAKKARQANMPQIQEAERQQAACMIQASWRLHRHRQQQAELHDERLTCWAAEHYAAAQSRHCRIPLPQLNDPAAAATAAVAAAITGEIDSEQLEAEVAAAAAAGGEGSRRLRAREGDDSAGRKARPVVQPFSRQVGRAAAPASSPQAPAGSSKAKWRGAAHGAMAASALAGGAAPPQQASPRATQEEATAGDGVASAAAAGHATLSGDATQHQQQQQQQPVLLQGVAVVNADLEAGLTVDRASWSGHKVPRTSSVSGAIVGLGSKLVSNLAALLRPGRGKSSVAGDLEAALAAIHNGEGEDQQPEAPAAAPAAPVSKRHSLDFGALFRRRSVDAPAGTLSPAGSLGPGASSRCSMPGSGADSGSTANPAGAGEAAAGSAGPAGGLRRRSSIDLMLSGLFGRRGTGGRRGTDEARPSPQQQPSDSTASSIRSGRQLLAAPVTAGLRLAQASSLYSCSSELVAATPSRDCAAHPLSSLSTARPSSTDAESDLQARGAAAASAYLEAAAQAATDRAGVMSLCGGLAASAAQVPASFSLSGGMAGGAPAAAAGSGLLSTEPSSSDFGLLPDGSVNAADAATQAAAAAGFESVWQSIQARTAPVSAPAVQDAAKSSSSSLCAGPVGVATIGFQPPRPLLVAGDAAAPSSANSSGRTTPASTRTLHEPWKGDGAASPSPCGSPTAPPPHPPAVPQPARQPGGAVNPRLVKRQYGLKAADMAADVEAVLTEGPPSPGAAGGVRGRGYTSASSPTSAHQAAAVVAAAGAAAEPSASAGTRSLEQPGKSLPAGSILTENRQQARPPDETAASSDVAASALFRPVPQPQAKQRLQLPSVLGAAAGKAPKLESAGPVSQPTKAAPSRGAARTGSSSSRALTPTVTSRASAEQLVSMVMAAAGGASGGARASSFSAALDRAAGQRRQPVHGMRVSGSSSLSVARLVRRNSFSNDGSAPSGCGKGPAAAAAEGAPALITAVPPVGSASRKLDVAQQARRLSAAL